MRHPAIALATLASATLVALPASSPTPAVAATPAARLPQTMYVAVNVATVWTDPSKARKVDRPALTDPANPARWLRTMTSAQKADLTSSNRTQTQALYGAKVRVLARKNGWSQ